jgi:hypothetical protein
MTYRPARRVDAAFDPATSPSAPSEYRIRAMLDGLGEVAAEIDRVWGVGRLRLLVSDPLRAKFDEQQARVDAAVASGQESFVRVQVEAMQRAWQALDRAARATGHEPLPSEVWEVALPSSGEVISFVRDAAHSGSVPQGRPVFTLPEIARLIETLGPTVLEAKRVFPGAAITHLHSNKPFDWSKGDDMPF